MYCKEMDPKKGELRAYTDCLGEMLSNYYCGKITSFCSYLAKTNFLEIKVFLAQIGRRRLS